MNRTLAFFALLLAGASAAAQHRNFVVDPAASQVNMTLKTNHEVVNGTFHVQSGNISFDRSAPAMSGSVDVAAGSGSTGSGSRDKKMSNDILKAPQFATVSFAPRSYTGILAAAGDSTLQVSGTLTLLGTAHEMTIPMQVHLDGTNAAAKAHFSIPYVQWGLKDPSFLVFKAEKSVDLDLNLVGHLN